MVRKYFGTDGIRGKANEGAMTAETALRVGMAAGRVFRRGDHRHRVVIGKDTRLSGYMLWHVHPSTLPCRGIVIDCPPALYSYSAMWKPIRLRAGAAAAA